MDSKLGVLVALGVFMAVTSYYAGAFSSSFGADFKYKNWMSLFSMGIMIGTSMLFMIPEGIGMMGNDIGNYNVSMSVGFPLLVGFLLMLLIDNMNAMLEYWGSDSSTQSGESTNGIKSALHSVISFPVTIGFVVHAAMDGVSLGITFFSENESLKFIFYLSIILHKLPTSFSLGAILMEEIASSSVRRYHILAFALSSPTFAVMTYLFIALFKMENNYVVALLFLFSAGMFQYVIFHVITEANRYREASILAPSSSESGFNTLQERSPGFTAGELVATLIGTLIPSLLCFLKE